MHGTTGSTRGVAPWLQGALVIAVPAHVLGLTVCGTRVPVRLTRQFRLAGLSGPVVWVLCNDSQMGLLPTRALRDLKKEGIIVTSLQGMEGLLQGLKVRRFVYVSGEIVFSGDGLFEALRESDDKCVFTEYGWGSVLSKDVDFSVLKRWMSSLCLARPESLVLKKGVEQKSLTVEKQKFFGRLKNEKDVCFLEKEVLKHVGRPQDPNFARLTRGPLSNSLSLTLAKMEFTPNMVTTMAILTGLTGAFMISQMSFGWVFLGALMLIASRVLDDCDGAVARMTIKQTPFGAVFDISGDIIVYLALFAALGFGLHFERPDFGHLTAMYILVAGAVITTVLLFIFVLKTNLREESRLIAFLERTASGDVAYFFFPFAVINRPEWFLWASAVGSQVFWMLLAIAVFLHKRKKNDQRAF